MGANLLVDTRQQKGKHEIKNEWWASHGVSTSRCKLDFGDYMVDGSNISIDTKRDIDEIAKNINGKNHDRFKRECQRAAAAGYRLVILVENRDGVISLEDLEKWINGHCRACKNYRTKKCDPCDSSTKCGKHNTRKPIQGARLAKAMSTMSERYGVRFEFCDPHDAARRICFLLGIDYELTCSDCYRFDNGTCKAGYRFTLIEGPAAPTDGKNRMCEWGCVF